VIMRLALFGALIDMAEDAEAELRILVEDLPLRPVLGKVLADELRVGARSLDKRADLFAALGAGVGGKDAVTIGGELFESVSHRLIPLIWIGGQIAELLRLCRRRIGYKARRARAAAANTARHDVADRVFE
jgi:hypothetical protein